MSKMCFGFFLVPVLFLAGCNAISTATLPVAIQTPFPQSTNTSLPTATLQPVVPTFTLEPSLKTDGPLFAYFREVDGIYQIIMMDSDGGGRRVISLPEGITDSLPGKEYGLDMRFISPDGKWLAFYTGFVGEMSSTPAVSEKYDLALNLLDLATGNVQTITRLLSDDYPNNFELAAKKHNDSFITPMDLEYAFLAGITRAIAWSPDGHYLAFAGQMDGLSSDLYLYNVAEKSVRRLSSGDQEVQWINWSPDGKWILHASVFWVGQGMTFDIYAATVGGTSARYISTNSLYTGIHNWLSPRQYFEYDNQNGVGDHVLRLVDVETGGISTIWDGSFLSYSFEKNSVVVIGMTPDMLPPTLNPNTNFSPGPYLIDLATLKKTKINFPSDGIFLDYAIFPFGYGEQKFVLIGDGSDSYFLSENMELTPFDLKGAIISVSPDKSHWVSVTQETITVYSLDNAIITSIPVSLSNVKTADITWTPDSLGFFIVQESNVYFIDILRGMSNLVETNLMQSHYGHEYLWIGGK